MKIVIVTGTRPDIIKQAPIYWEAKKRGHDAVLVHACQHYPYYLFEGVYEDMQLPKPDYIIHSNAKKKLGMVASKTTHFLDEKFPSAGISKKFEKTVLGVMNVKPNAAATVADIMNGMSRLYRGPLADAGVTVVHGDTLTCMASALAAHLNLKPVAHAEAGLRTFSREPFPEQTDTRCTDACSDLFFAATQTNRKNLLNEGFPEEKIVVVGNTVVDAANWAAGARQGSQQYFEKMGVDFSKPIVYYSCHRRENTMHRERFEAIVDAAVMLAQTGVQVFWSMRPGTVFALKEHGLQGRLREQNIIVASDVPRYTDVMFLASKCLFIATDSGSMQEESAALRVPCVTLRFVTDRPESVEAGVNILAPPTTAASIYSAFQKAMRENDGMRKKKNPYGDGTAAKKIVDALEKFDGKLIVWKHQE